MKSILKSLLWLLLIIFITIPYSWATGVTVTPKTTTLLNGTANNATVVNSMFGDVYTNDSTLASYINGSLPTLAGNNGFTGANTFSGQNTFSGYALFSALINAAKSSDPSTPSPGDFWYSSTNNQFEGAVQIGTVSGATNASPIVITTAANHGLTTGQTVIIAGVVGNTAANGSWTITVTSPTQFSLTGSTGNAAYTSGGTVSVIGTIPAIPPYTVPYPIRYHGSAVPTSTVTSSAGTGTVTVSSSSTTITFSTSQSGLAGAYITTAGGQTRVIVSGSGTSWTVNSNFDASESTVSWSSTLCTSISLASLHERDSTNAANIDTTSSSSLALTSTGLGGLDTGSVAANTFYYVYAVTNGFTVGLMASTVNESSSGSISNANYTYTYKRQLPIALLTNGGNGILPFYIRDGWPNRPVVVYNLPTTTYNSSSASTVYVGPLNILSNGSATTFTAKTASQMPAISTQGLFFHMNNTGAFALVKVRPTGTVHSGMVIGQSSYPTALFQMGTNSSQQIDYQSGSTGGNAEYIDNIGYVVTGNI